MRAGQPEFEQVWDALIGLEGDAQQNGPAHRGEAYFADRCLDELATQFPEHYLLMIAVRSAEVHRLQSGALTEK